MVKSAAQGRDILILRNSVPTVIVTSVDKLQRFNDLDEEIQDINDQVAAMIRMMAEDGTRHSLDDVVRELDIDEAEDA